LPKANGLWRIAQRLLEACIADATPQFETGDVNFEEAGKANADLQIFSDVDPSSTQPHYFMRQPWVKFDTANSTTYKGGYFGRIYSHSHPMIVHTIFTSQSYEMNTT
jgi:flagellar basal body rod protein FlgB